MTSRIGHVAEEYGAHGGEGGLRVCAGNHGRPGSNAAAGMSNDGRCILSGLARYAMSLLALALTPSGDSCRLWLGSGAARRRGGGQLIVMTYI